VPPFPICHRGGYAAVLPWVVPGMALAVGVGYLLRVRLGDWLGTRPVLAWAMVVSLGLILSATLTPTYGQFDFGAVSRGCDLSRIGFIPLQDLFRVDDPSLNVVLFMPLGTVLAAMGGRPRVLAVMLGAAALPFAIEGTQLLVPALDRGCQSADVFDNLTGLAAGLVLGAVARWWHGVATRPAAG